jgi:hypothetical protein
MNETDDEKYDEGAIDRLIARKLPCSCREAEKYRKIVKVIEKSPKEEMKDLKSLIKLIMHVISHEID